MLNFKQKYSRFQRMELKNILQATILKFLGHKVKVYITQT